MTTGKDSLLAGSISRLVRFIEQNDEDEDPNVRRQVANARRELLRTVKERDKILAEVSE